MPRNAAVLFTASACRFTDGNGPFQFLDFEANAAGDAFGFSVLSEFTTGVGVYAFAAAPKRDASRFFAESDSLNAIPTFRSPSGTTEIKMVFAPE
jgi:hypothetical protein